MRRHHHFCQGNQSGRSPGAEAQGLTTGNAPAVSMRPGRCAASESAGSDTRSMTTCSPAILERLTTARADYHAGVSPYYDEVLHETATRIAGVGTIGKTDIGALLFWKRLRADTPWVRHLMAMPDSDVRAVTARVVAAVRDTSVEVPAAAAAGRSALTALPGFTSGDAFASALLLAAAPDRMAVYDRRVQKALDMLDIELTARRGRYGRYMGIVEGLRGGLSQRGELWTARDVDVALFWLGG